MESANIPHKSCVQEEKICSSTLDTSCYALGSPHAHAWTPNDILCNSSFASYSNASLNQSMINKDLGLEWNSTDTYGLQISQIKREIIDPYYQRYTEMISKPEASEVDDLNLKQFLSTLSCEGQNSNNGINQSCLEESGDLNLSPSKRVFGSQIYPTINVSEILNHQEHGYMGDSRTFGGNFQGLDRFDSGRFGGSFHHQLFQGLQVEYSKDTYGMDCMKQSVDQRSFESATNIQTLNKGTAKSTRPDQNSKPKRSRLESRASPPFKIRKEKLGDRIAALQQLVAPFGKTDTASVLMEAIGYIKFLQSQVETLSVPYLKLSRHKNNGAMPHRGYVENGNKEQKRDLKSTGLCLMPMSCLSYVADDGGGGGMWPPPPFG